MEARFWQDDPPGEPALLVLFDASRPLPEGVELLLDRQPAELRSAARLLGAGAAVLGIGTLALTTAIPSVLADPWVAGRPLFFGILLALAGWLGLIVRAVRRRFGMATEIEAGRRRFGAFLTGEALVLRLRRDGVGMDLVASLPWSLVEAPGTWHKRLMGGGTVPYTVLRYRPRPGAAIEEFVLPFADGGGALGSAIGRRLADRERSAARG